MHSNYADKGMIPGTETKGNPDRDVVTDMASTFVFLVAIYFPSITG